MKLSEAVDAAVRRHMDTPFEVLSPMEQILVAIWGLEADVNNGGFDQYYFNMYGDCAGFVPRALRTIGANRMADIVDAANRVFGSTGPPKSRDDRQSMLLDLSERDDHLWDDLDKSFQAYPDDIDALLERYFAAAATV